MITRFFAFIGSRRRVILAVALVLAACYLLVQAWVPSLGRRAFPALVAFTMISLLLAVLALAVERPKNLVVQPGIPAFSAPPHPGLVLIALGYFPIGTAMAGSAIRDWRSEPFSSDLVPALGYAAVLALWIVIAWGDTSTQLRPDGLWQHGIMGRLFVPWDAAPVIPAPPPASRDRTILLTYGRPELVRRYGLQLHPNRLRTDHIDPGFLGAAIRYYLAHPERRPDIGTRDEYERVLPRLLNPLDRSTPPCAPRP
ncbi:hypothetical protein OHA21_18030 [Actinoplanes sp. NBC_00393]|uniref:hypothetical protein n=1 Tax=Actinoplanes sp. NBC_00393 TaxID=2975953 RepID=UPI002E251FA6